MTQLTDGEHKALMEDMRRFDEQMPCVGIFWYAPADKALFGVCKQELTPKMTTEAAERINLQLEFNSFYTFIY